MEEKCAYNPNQDFEHFAEHLDILFEECERRFADLAKLEEISLYFHLMKTSTSMNNNKKLLNKNISKIQSFWRY